jgi:hypothetical protein
MRLMHFHQLRSGVQDNASPSKGVALIAMEGILRDRLTRSGLFDTVEVEHTHDTDRLLAAFCHFRVHLDETAVVEAVESIWCAEVCYEFWEIHAAVVDDDFVEFQAATRQKVNGPYVTVHLIAQRSPVPAQRDPRTARRV